MSSKKSIVGDSQFSKGMDSLRDSVQLGDGFIRASMNTVNRGNVVQCRPGYEWKFTPPDGRIQGAFLFHPTNDFEQQVFVIDGIPYRSSYPFREFSQIPGVSFRSDVTDIYFEEAEKSVQRLEDGVSIQFITPFKVLIIQDGLSPPVAWDGSSAVILTNPSDTPIGTLMKWSGNRLWVARGKELFAGDIYDPLSNREGTYISDAKSFLFDKPISALAEVTYSATFSLLVFTESTTSSIRSDVAKRSTWENVDKFQNIVFPNIGCVSYRSVTTFNGLLWWHTGLGLTNFNAALATFVSSEFKYLDGEMAISRGFLHTDLSHVACAAFENYFLMSVPYADVWNAHTWVMDQSTSDTATTEAPATWNSFWTGTRPVVWLTGKVQGRDRIFHFSRDLDGKNRCWEAFSSERLDNGCPITWTCNTRGYTDGNLALKSFVMGELSITEFQGTVDVAVFWAGVTKGAFKRCLTKRIEAPEGSMDSDIEYDEAQEVFSLKKQSRIMRTVDVMASKPNETSCDVESPLPETLDTGFELFLVCSGPGALKAVRMHLLTPVEDTKGRCEDQEHPDENFVRFDGAGSDDQEDLAEPAAKDILLETFTATKTIVTEVNGDSRESTATSESRISPDDADKIASCQAKADADEWFIRHSDKIVGDPDNPAT